MNKRKNKKKKKAGGMIDAIRTMIKHAEKGPSGFWVDDREGCGNKDIFPEFEKALKTGSYARKDHDICPWNTGVMYGKGHGNIHTGCAHSCSIRDAGFLTAEQIKTVLSRFLDRYQNGEYEDKDNISALLTVGEMESISKSRKNSERARERKIKQERKERIQKASSLLSRCKNKEWKSTIIDCYGSNYSVTTSGGIVDFAPEGVAEIVGGEDFTYDDYLFLQFSSLKTCRKGFAMIYSDGYEAWFKGQIEKKSKTRVCFTRIYINGMYHDGIGFEDREDHVWMDIKGFENFSIGDCVEFSAEIYRYLKTGNGKKLDYGLRNPECVMQIESYRLPSDDDLLMQFIDRLICDDMCMFSEHCYMGMCIANEEWRNATRSMLYDALKKEDKKSASV